MDTHNFFEIYHLKLALIALLGGFGIPAISAPLLKLVPALKQTGRLNKIAASQRQKRSYYIPTQKRSGFWGIFTLVSVFVVIVPFVINVSPPPWWKIPRDIFVILMTYDFFYYLTHRFAFHDGGFGPGPLMWMHATHHQNKNPCRMDSNFLHPLETCIGISLYGCTIAVLGALMGGFHLATILVTTIAFTEINLHNHDLMDVEDRFPYKYLKYAADMHHVHHARFTAGNFATISLFYDWLFGTYDKGQGWKRPPQLVKTADGTADGG